MGASQYVDRLSKACAQRDAWKETAERLQVELDLLRAEAAKASGEPFVLELPGYRPPGLNGKDGLMRMHWGQVEREKESAILRLSAALGRRRPRFDRCRIRYTRFYGAANHEMDWDNFGASFKLLGDALVKTKVLPDDGPRFVRSLDLRQACVRRRKEEGVRIELEPLEKESESR